MDEIATSYIDEEVARASILEPEDLLTFHIHLSDHMAFRKYSAYTIRYILYRLEKSAEILKVWSAVTLMPVQVPAPDPRELSRCIFHQHATDVRCSLFGR
jgi:hypothetical protein